MFSHWVDNYCIFNLRPKQIVDRHSNESLINLTGIEFTQNNVIDCLFLYRVSMLDRNKMMDKIIYNNELYCIKTTYC